MYIKCTKNRTLCFANGAENTEQRLSVVPVRYEETTEGRTLAEAQAA